MEDIFCFKHEIPEVLKSLELVTSKIFTTKNIINYIELNGINSFPIYYDLRPVDCPYCEHQLHYLHKDMYIENILNALLENSWKEDIFLVYFRKKDLEKFWLWLGTYIKSIHNRLVSLNIYAC